MKEKINKSKKKIIGTKVEDTYHLIDSKTPFAVKEAFGLLRTNILYASAGGEKTPVYGVVSAGESSGKSVIVSNLALAFAKSGKKTLLIDADMRCPVLHKIFGYEKNHKGLSEYISGLVDEKSDIIFDTDREGLYVVPAGHIPPNPSELIISNRFAALIEELREDYDYIFIDLPPISIVSDALAVVNSIDGYMFVVRSNFSERISVRESIEKLEQIEARIVGIVLNDLNFKDGMQRSKYRGKYGRYSRYGKYSKYNGTSRYEISHNEANDKAPEK